MSSILATGVSGWLGDILISQLINDDVNFYSAVSNGLSFRRFENQGLNPVVLNFYQPKTIPAALQDKKVFFLSFPLQENMIEWSGLLIDSIKNSSIEHVVLLSCTGADDETDYLMSQTYGIIEKMIIESGKRYTFIRPCFLMQSFSSFFYRTINLFNAIYLPCDTQAINFFDARDLVRIISIVLKNPDNYQSKVINLTGRKPLNLFVAAEMIARMAGKCVNYYPVEVEKAKGSLQQLKLSPFFIDALISFARYCSVHENTVTNDYFEITGVEPTKFETYVIDYLKAWK